MENSDHGTTYTYITHNNTAPTEAITCLCLTQVDRQTILKLAWWTRSENPSLLERKEPGTTKMASQNSLRQS